MSAHPFPTMRDAVAALDQLERRRRTRAEARAILTEHDLLEVVNRVCGGERGARLNAVAADALMLLFSEVEDRRQGRRLAALLVDGQRVAEINSVDQSGADAGQKVPELTQDGAVHVIPAHVGGEPGVIENHHDVAVGGGTDDLKAPGLESIRTVSPADKPNPGGGGHDAAHSDLSCGLQPGDDAESAGPGNRPAAEAREDVQ